MKQLEIFFQDVVKRLYTNPCRIFGIPPTSDHETYIEVDMSKSWVIPDAPKFSKAQWTPFAGRNVTGCVTRVILRGELAYIDGKVGVSMLCLQIKSIGPFVSNSVL